MCADIMGEVAGLVPAHKAAVVRGYSRRTVRGECYPGLVEAEDGHVSGVLYCGISALSWKRIDRFEGTMYARRLVIVELNDGSLTEAFTYVFRSEFRKMLSENTWDYATFMQRGFSRFRRHYRGYENL